MQLHESKETRMIVEILLAEYTQKCMLLLLWALIFQIIQQYKLGFSSLPAQCLLTAQY